jgi:hypothetical protein
MCVCASEASRSRLFNCITVLLVTFWVLVVSVVAHTLEVQPVVDDQSMNAFIEQLIN